MLERPAVDEFAEFYGRYVAAVPEGPVLEFLAAQRQDATELLGEIPKARGGYRYAPGKWSLKEVVGHVVDSERMFAMRALAFARRDPAALPGFDENDYAAASGADARQLPDLLEEFAGVRHATLLLFRGLAPEAWNRRGIASGREFSVRGLAWIIAGHAAHHMDMIRRKYVAGHGA